MKAAVLYGKEDVRLENVPVPTPSDGELLIKIEAALTCGTDLKIFRNGSHPKMIQLPALFGHEFAGIIETVGREVDQWKPGMRVVAANSAPCRNCLFCVKGQPNLCRDLLFVNGAYAEFLRIPARIVQENLLEIPAGVSFETAALTEPLACVLRGFQSCQLKKGETVVILGAGPIGLMFVQLASHAHARVILVGKGDQRLKLAKTSGAEMVFDLTQCNDPIKVVREATPESEGADVIVEAVGRPTAWTQALQMVRPGGRVLLFGGCPTNTQVPLDTGRFHYNELTLFSAFHHTPETIRAALKLLADGTIQSKYLITDSAPLDELPQIFRQMLMQQNAIKTAIKP